MAVSCGNCGAEVDTDWQFCRSCGAELDGADGQSRPEDSASSSPMPAVTETDAREQRDADTDTPRRTDGLTEEEARARRKVTTVLLVGLALLVALVGGGLLVLELLGR